MKKILIVSNALIIGGAEKLIFEIVQFALDNGLQPTVLILENYQREHYDEIYKKLGVKVIRTRIQNIVHIREPIKMIRSIFWSMKLKHFAKSTYESLHVIGLYNSDKIIHTIPHVKRFFWHVNNSVQFYDNLYPYPPDLFGIANDTIVCINKYQLEEFRRQYDMSVFKSRLILFKLFYNPNDPN